MCVTPIYGVLRADLETFQEWRLKLSFFINRQTPYLLGDYIYWATISTGRLYLLGDLKDAPGLVIGPCIVEIDRINRCRNEEIIVKDNFGWVWPIMVGAPQVEIDRIVIRDVQNEEIIEKGNFEWAWPMWAGCPRIDRIVIRECRNEEIIVKGNFGWAWPMWPGRPRIDRIVIREAQYQFEVNRCRNEEVNFQGSSANRRMDGQMHITTISPLFLRKTWG
ncbi:hypothetical protein DPMN_134659 [Dreissena polymorpha]|uniref:Uncharacterized protein n=1 Tax=Dreissena polymorpha TaxID=45954 RepID=A0A9D4G0I0_DREPO|nr:hypothetical protein DPMN_134659 [Dreissena polymorpha]